MDSSCPAFGALGPQLGLEAGVAWRCLFWGEVEGSWANSSPQNVLKFHAEPSSAPQTGLSSPWWISLCPK